MRTVKRLLPVAALSLVLLSGCADNPSVAARVNGQEISVGDVDVLTQALCAERSSSGQAPATSLAAVRSSALAALIDSHIDADLAAKQRLGYQPLTLARQMQQLQSLIGRLPEKDRAAATRLITDLLRGQLQLQSEVVRRLEAAGQTPNAQNVAAGVQQLEAQHGRSVAISVNPVYAYTSAGKLADGTQSVSKAVSAEATGAAALLSGQPDAGYVGTLPADQKCS